MNQAASRQSRAEAPIASNSAEQDECRGDRRQPAWKQPQAQSPSVAVVGCYARRQYARRVETRLSFDAREREHKTLPESEHSRRRVCASCGPPDVAMVKPLSVVVVGRITFPTGGASTSRVRSISLGLAEAGAQVRVVAAAEENSVEICSSPAGGGRGAIESKWRGIDCTLVPHTTLASRRRGRYAFLREQQRIGSAVVATLASTLSRAPADVVISYDQDFTIAFRIARTCDALRTPLIQQYAEHQLPCDFRGGRFSPYYWGQQATFKWLPSRSAGSIPISRYLEEICQRNGARNLLLVPALSNTEEPPTPTIEAAKLAGAKRPFVLTYLGHGSRRDRVDRMIDLVHALVRQGIDAKLQLVGLGSEALKAVNQRSNGSERAVVDARGWATTKEVRTALAEAGALLWFRENDISGLAAFPTRLPEYLLTRRPVVCSPVGDVPHYLKDGEEIVYLDLNDLDAMVAKVRALIEDPERADAIGRAGHEAALREFHYSAWGPKLAAFARDVVSSTNRRAS